tara:strand:+ start:1290 stop:1817 length:528 start_codon:yes stop_codon:yes gene_type:complete
VKKLDISEKAVKDTYLSIGSNLGDKIINIEKAKYYISELNIKIIKTSSLYETASWPNKNFPKFVNIVLKVRTSFELTDLFLEIKKIEKLLGRGIQPKNHPRTCDIDIIDFNGINRKIINKKISLIVPHARMHKRNFVLFPLYEVNNNWVHPKKNLDITKLMSNLSINQIRGIKIL